QPCPAPGTDLLELEPPQDDVRQALDSGPTVEDMVRHQRPVQLRAEAEDGVDVVLERSLVALFFLEADRLFDDLGYKSLPGASRLVDEPDDLRLILQIPVSEIRPPSQSPKNELGHLTALL